MHYYSKEETALIQKYKCIDKKTCANGRYEDKIATIDVLNVLKRFKFKCVYCSDNLDPRYWQLDHFYPNAMGGKNKIENFCCTCRWCNVMKNALDGYAFIHKCRKIVDNNIIHELVGKHY